MVILGSGQAVSLVVFAVSIMVESERAHSTLGKPIAEAAIYAVFGLALAGLCAALARGKAWARTPFALLQVFAFIVGSTLLQGSGDWAHAAGAAVVASSLVALAGVVRTAVR